MTRASFLAAFAAALLPLGCGGEDTSEPDRGPPSTDGTVASQPASRPGLCTQLRARVMGHVTTDAATELSGLAVSQSQAGVLWAHNDSGDRARVLAVASSGRPLADITVSGADHVDWEDIAIGPAPDGRDALYIGDIGDNDANRSAIVVYRMPEPRLREGSSRATGSAERLTLRYPDSAHDAEALLVDRSTGALVIVTKDETGIAGVYVADDPSTNDTTTMRRAGRVSLGPGQAITAGDISANSRVIVLRTRDRAFVWMRHRDESIRSTMRRQPCAARADLSVEGKGEALAVTRRGNSFYTVPEGERPAVRRYAPG